MEWSSIAIKMNKCHKQLIIILLTQFTVNIQSLNYSESVIRTRVIRSLRTTVKVDDIPKPFDTPSSNKRPRLIRIPSSPVLDVPPGFKVNVFAEELVGPRWLALTPSGDVLVTETPKNEITLLRDSDGDGVADFKSTFASKAANGLHIPFGMDFAWNKDGGQWDDYLFFVGNTNHVRRFRYKYGADNVTEQGTKIADLPGYGYNQHWTRNVVVSPFKTTLYVTVGSESNVAIERLPRASIMKMNLDGSNQRIFASGLRNPVGLDFHPATYDLYTTVNERDGLGDDLVPDYFTRVRQNDFYGWPYAYLRPDLLDPRMLNSSDSIGVHQKGTHCHDEWKPTSRLPSPVRSAISTYAAASLKPIQIKRCLQAQNIDVPSTKQLSSCLLYQRRRLRPSDLPVGFDTVDLQQWCQNRTALPDDIHQPYVSSYSIIGRDDLFLFITTRHLSGIMPKTSLLQVDCIYKLIWNDYPVLIPATSDSSRRLHPFGVSLVSSDERAETYQSIFNALSSASEQLGNEPFIPAYVMADGCPGITAAASSCFPGAKRLMCWFHVRQRCKQHRGSGFPGDKWAEIDRDIGNLHLSPTDDLFLAGSKLFITKWQKDSSETVRKFINYFEKQWLKSLPNWFEGAAPLLPSTNNGLESLNKRIKELNTMRKKLPLPQFLIEADKMVRDWSVDSESHGFLTEVDYYKHESRHSARSWIESPEAKQIFRLLPDFYCVPSTNVNGLLSDNWFDLFYSSKFTSFEEYCSFISSFYMVFKDEGGKWHCFCPFGLKRGACKHLLGVLHLMGEVELPEMLNEKRKRGRPAKVGLPLAFI